MSDTRSIDKSIRIKASADAVWKALTEAEGLTRWFAPEARVTPGQGGNIFLSWGGGMEGESRIDIWDPPRHLRTEFGKDPAGVGLYVDYFVGEEGGETVVRLVHSGFAAGADWDNEYDSHERGWTLFMLNLKHALERHAGRPCIQSIVSRKVELSREEAWSRLASVAHLERDGDTVRFVTPGGTALAGHVEHFAPARDVALTLPALDDSRLNLSFEGSKDATFLYGVLLSYSIPPATAEENRRELQALIDLV